ncbi:hypothetical protein JCM16161A_01770 [Vulcanisaeta sp. JCM 16161]|uniref:A24 family peptidase n=1 Tax=Vulcanisaeta sp. JCM 16161 TaxID=1295372 RepID=UPI0006CFF6C0|nr:A24 family peptidase [Vulcanisaeta sp. JCM 16161]
MVNPYALLMVDYLVVLVVQVVASIQDLRTREISDWTWVIGSIICVPLGLYVAILLHQLTLYIIGAVVGSVFALAVYWLRAMGGADSKSIAFISASIPTLPMASPALTVINITPLSVLINSLVIALVIYIPYNVIQNIRYGGDCEALSRVKGLNRMIYLITLMCVPANKVFRNPNNYAISQEPNDGGFQPVIKLGLDVEDPRELLIEWLSQGRINVDTPVLVSYHIPFIVPITLGLIMYMAVHANFLTLALSSL